MFVKFLFLNQRSSLGVVVITFGFSAEALVWIWVKAIFCLHFNSAAKKVQNQIHPGRILHVHQKCIFTLPLQQKKYKIKFTQDEYHMYIRVVQGRTLLPWSLKYKNYIPVWVQWWYCEQHSLSFEIERRLWNILSWLKSFDHFARINFFLIRQWAHALFNKQQ